jgi:hypothetical protein
MLEESPDAEVRKDPGDFSRKIPVFLVSGVLRGDVAMMDQGLSEIEIILDDMNKIGQFHYEPCFPNFTLMEWAISSCVGLGLSFSLRSASAFAS